MSNNNPICIVFLGNPGREYEKTRHNLGRMLADLVQERQSLSWNSKADYEFAQKSRATKKIYFCKPTSFMNNSGIAVRKFIDFFKIDPPDVIVAHDEIELPFGALSLRWGGGAGGHNGIRSLDAQLGTKDYLRIRMGVGRPSHGDVASFVLGRFDKDEEAVLPVLVEKAADIVDAIVAGKQISETSIQVIPV